MAAMTEQQAAGPAAEIHRENPAPLVLALHRQQAVGEGGITVDIAGFRRYRGDWLGVLITPAALQLYLVAGGGSLWRAVGADEALLADFPAGSVEFRRDAAASGRLAGALACRLEAAPAAFATQEAALQAGLAALEALFAPPPAAPLAAVEQGAAASPEAAPPAAGAPPPSRRAFFRRLLGQR